MSVWNNIRQEINTNIADNDQQLITAEKVRTTLTDIVNATETIENEIYEEVDTVNQNFEHYYTKSEIDTKIDTVIGDIQHLEVYFEDEINSVYVKTNSIADSVLAIQLSYATKSYVSSYYYDKEYIDNFESNVWYSTDDLDNRLSLVERSYATKSYVSTYYYDKTESNQLYKPTGLFFYFGDEATDELNCTVSYVNFINEDGPSGDFYLIEGSARYGAADDLVFNINRPYGSMYYTTYTMGLKDVATEAFTKALGAGHTPQINKFDKNINLTINYPNTYREGIIMVGNVNCDDEYSGEFTFSLVSAYEYTNVPMIINVGFKCWVQDVQQ